ncbi:MAG TPA: hypothetical protein VLV50_08175 [Stellaceae bacterium]|nr:hypothetical protein [Stellaceae bacterium]
MTAILRWGLVLALALLPILCVRAADAPQTARAEVGKPVQEAQALVRQRNYPAALERLKAADAVPDKSPYETYVIEETRAAALVASGDYSAGVGALEAVLATHILPPVDEQKRLLTVVELEFRLKDHAKTVAAANRYYQEGGSDPLPRQLTAQSYYLEGDYGAAEKSLDEIAAADTRAGKKPDENTLITLASSAFKANDENGYVAAMATLAGAYPKHEYWVNLYRAVAQRPGFAPRLALDLDRVAVATGAFDTSAQYVDAAERAIAAGFPGDAKSFLDQGFAAGILSNSDNAAKEQRLRDMAQHQAEQDAAALPAQARDADAAPTGGALEKLGEAYLSDRRASDATAALEKSLAKGGLDHPDDARLHLGMAYLAAGEGTKADAVFAAITSTDGDADLARMWRARGGK